MNKKVAGLFVFVLLHSTPSYAAPKLSAGDAYTVVSPTGKYLSCISKTNNSIVSGKVKGNLFIPATSELAKIKAQIANAPSQAKQKKLKNKLKLRKQEIRDADLLCRAGGGPQGSSSLEPLDRALSEEDVRYFLEKAGFGLGTNEQHLIDLGVTQGLAALVDAFMQTNSESSDLMPRVLDRLDGALGGSTTQTPAGQRAALVDLWVHTKNPYAERFALFLLSVWTASGDVIADETFRAEFWKYYSDILRAHVYADTDITALALSVTQNPLMLLYLNNDLNVKGNPNENYARELLELFLLGPTDLDGNPNYSETKVDGSGDIGNAAKALTGFRVKLNYQTNSLVTEYLGSRHEPGPHAIFAGKPYAFMAEDYDQLIRGIITNHPGVKIYYAKEILREYLTPTPSRELIENFAKVIAANGYRLRPAMANLFKSKAFFDSAYRNTVPKNGAEFVVEFVRTMGLQDGINYNEVQKYIAAIGLEANFAPSVFWYPQSTWISPSAVLEGANAVAKMLGDTTAHAQAEPDWSILNQMPVGALADSEILAQLAKKLGVSLSENERAALLNYMNTERQYNGVINASPYDNTNAIKQRRVGGGLAYALTSSSDFHLR